VMSYITRTYLAKIERMLPKMVKWGLLTEGERRKVEARIRDKRVTSVPPTSARGDALRRRRKKVLEWVVVLLKAKPKCSFRPMDLYDSGPEDFKQIFKNRGGASREIRWILRNMPDERILIGSDAHKLTCRINRRWFGG